MQLKFVTDKPALLLGKTLVVADLHIGKELEFYRSGIKIPSQTERMKRELDDVLKQTGAKRLVILGDVKHKVPGVSKQELREIPEFLSYFSEKIGIDILKGNHDAGLEGFLPEKIKLHVGKGLFLNGVYLTHGHSWPPEDFLKAEYVVAGHDHPRIDLKDKMGFIFSEKVWVVSELMEKPITKKYRLKEKQKIPKMVLMPAFNSLSSGVAINRPIDEIERSHRTDRIGVLLKSAKLNTAKIYLLDGTFLGNLKDLF